ncbi:MAG: RsmB/NOP family class I SAM-dependent RNA methyltransferase [Sphingomonadales bacterium]
MTPAARLAAVIEIMDAVETGLRGQGAPADQILREYLKTRRYVGAKDRRAIADRIYGILRRRGANLWALQEAGMTGAVSGRVMVLADCALYEPAELALFGAGGYGPTALNDAEQALAEQLAGVTLDAMPPAARANLPEQIYVSLFSRFGRNLEQELEALEQRAPLDLRVNRLKTTRAAARQALAEAGIMATPTPFSPWGLRVEPAQSLANQVLYRDGGIEIQDEAAQVAALLSAAESGERVVDLCAGAGGKTLAMAAMMAGAGGLMAADVDGRRLDMLRRRATRAGLGEVPAYLLPLAGPQRQAALASLGADADMVFLDVPCSGSGTWRRNPDLRWRHDASQLKALAARQAVLIDEGLALLKPGGRLIYATCSLLQPENEDQIAAALVRHSDTTALDYRHAWPSAVEGACPETASHRSDCLLMTPARHGCDGFFVAILTKTGCQHQ